MRPFYLPYDKPHKHKVLFVKPLYILEKNNYSTNLKITKLKAKDAIPTTNP